MAVKSGSSNKGGLGQLLLERFPREFERRGNSVVVKSRPGTVLREVRGGDLSVAYAVSTLLMLF